jgi:L-fuculose-phosphate aldolase
VPAADGGEAAARKQIVETCRKLHEQGLIAGAEGNVSTRVRAGRILITPAGVAKADLRSRDLVSIDETGRARGGARRPSTEIAMHLRVYRRRPDVRAIVHAHPPVATAFAVAGETFDSPVLPEVVLALGPIALVPYATPGTEALADELEPFADRHDVFLLSNHGATTVGPSLSVAYSRMESLEHSARILLAARLLGRVRTLTAEQLRALVAARDEASRPRP